MNLRVLTKPLCAGSHFVIEVALLRYLDEQVYAGQCGYSTCSSMYMETIGGNVDAELWADTLIEPILTRDKLWTAVVLLHIWDRKSSQSDVLSFKDGLKNLFAEPVEQLFDIWDSQG